MSQQRDRIRMAAVLKDGLGKRFLARSLRSVLIAPASLIWFCVCASYGQLQTQPSPLFQVPEAEAALAPEQPLPGSINGTVVDESGAVIVGAQVTLTFAGQSPPQQGVSGEYGEFSFARVAPGNFEVNVIAPGFAPRTFTGTLHPGQAYIVPPRTLTPATVSTAVVVTASRVEVAEAQVRAQEKQRVLAVIPNFYVSYVPDAAPLSSKQKFRLAWRTMIDPITIGLTAGAAGVQQAQNDFPGYGQGAQGYAKRFGALYADNAAGTFIGGAILPSLLKQDPRYFYKGTGSAGSRVLHAIASSVMCKGDNQRWQPNYSAILGSIASGGISNLYRPDDDRGAGLVFESVLVGIGENAVVNLFQEFVMRKFTTNVPN